MLELAAAQTSAIAAIASGLSGVPASEFLPKTDESYRELGSSAQSGYSYHKSRSGGKETISAGSPKGVDQTLDEQRNTLIAFSFAMGAKVPEKVLKAATGNVGARGEL